MKVKIKDFIIAMGNICNEYIGESQQSYKGCPFNIDTETFHGCIRDKQSEPKFAEIIKNETLKYMKKGGR